MTDQAPTTPDTVVVPTQALEAIAHNLCSLHGFDPDFVMGQEKFARAVITEYLRAARPAATPGLWTEDMERERREADYERGFRHGKETAFSEAGFTPVAWRGRDLDAFGDGAWAVCTFKPSCDVVEPLYTHPVGAATPGGEREDSAFKIASDLHAAYEQLIYGLPKYLEAENLTDEENMIREAYITLDVTAHRLAALSRTAPVAAVDLESGEARVAIVNIVERYVSGWSGEHADNPYDAAPLLAQEILDALATPTPQPAAARGGEDMDWQSVAMWMGFAASAIKSGEAWSSQCQQHYEEALAAFSCLNDALSAKGGS